MNCISVIPKLLGSDGGGTSYRLFLAWRLEFFCEALLVTCVSYPGTGYLAHSDFSIRGPTKIRIEYSRTVACLDAFTHEL